jgi:putative transcriptional regulator
MSDRDIGQEVLEGIREVKAFKSGDGNLRTRSLEKSVSPKAIRTRLKLSQAAFAGLLGVSLRTLQDWEQGRREPGGPARRLLYLADQHPEIFAELP